MKVIVLILICCASVLGDKCYDPERVPDIPVPNSPYSIVDASLCCPENHVCKWTDKEMECLCPHGIVNEPCVFCMTCAAGLGEMCGGPYAIRGRCGDGLHCVMRNGSVIYMEQSRQNVTGVCERIPVIKPTPPSTVPVVVRRPFEECGKTFTENGVCGDGHNCTRIGQKINICIPAGHRLRDNCFKNCTKRPVKKSCGDDGRVYDNPCFLKQQNCLQEKSVKPMTNISDCDVCEDIETTLAELLPTGTGVVYSDTLHPGSVATFRCKPGFNLTEDTGMAVPEVSCKCSDGDCKWKFKVRGTNNFIAYNGQSQSCYNTCEAILEGVEPLVPTRNTPTPAKTIPTQPTKLSGNTKLVNSKSD